MTPGTPVLDARLAAGRPGGERDTAPGVASDAVQGCALLVGPDGVEPVEPAPATLHLQELSPVFVDSSGRRRRHARRLAWAVAALCAIYLAFFGTGLAGRPVHPSVPSGVLVGGPTTTTSESATPTTPTAPAVLPWPTFVDTGRTTAKATTRRTVPTPRRTTAAVAPRATLPSPTASLQTVIGPSTTTGSTIGSTTGSSPTTTSSTGATTTTGTTTTPSDETSTDETETTDGTDTETGTETETDTDTGTETDTETGTETDATDQTGTDRTATDEAGTVSTTGGSR